MEKLLLHFCAGHYINPGYRHRSRRNPAGSNYHSNIVYKLPELGMSRNCGPELCRVLVVSAERYAHPPSNYSAEIYGSYACSWLVTPRFSIRLECPLE